MTQQIQEVLIDKTRERVKNLNPIRQMRDTNTQQLLSNNDPNAPGQDNGMNAWLDAQLDPNAQDEHEQIRYAKRNSDFSRFHDINDVPTRGPTAPIQAIGNTQPDME